MSQLTSEGGYRELLGKTVENTDIARKAVSMKMLIAGKCQLYFRTKLCSVLIEKSKIDIALSTRYPSPGDTIALTICVNPRPEVSSMIC